MRADKRNRRLANRSWYITISMFNMPANIEKMPLRPFLKRPLAREALYFIAWLIPAFIASFVNYIVVLEGQPDANWFRYFSIHFFYWMAWGLITRLVYARTLPRLKFRLAALSRFTFEQAAILVLTIVYFAGYYWVINPDQFDGTQSIVAWLRAMFLQSGPVLFHTMNMVTYLFVLGLCMVVRQAAYARQQEQEHKRLEAALAKTRISALTKQIHPHFFFNAMNNIASMIEQDDREAAYDAVTLLSQLLRDTFSFSRLDKITVQQELKLVETQLEIGRFRFENRLNWTVEKPSNASQLMIPPFIIQPIVENALKHGLEETTHPVFIEIFAIETPDGLKVCVRDNGPGASIDAIGKDVGTGLTNLRDRLQLMGADMTKFHIDTSPGKGFGLQFIIPVGDHNE